MGKTPQEKFWATEFGDEYTERNLYNTPDLLDEFYKKTFGISRSEMNFEFLNDIKIDKILEVGCNIGNQLNLLQDQGYKNLYGIDIQPYAVEKAKEFTKGINIIAGSIFDIPFKDNYFDLVYTAGVLIHISPNDIKKAMREIYRASKKYIWGYEYFNEEYKAIKYRDNPDRLWKGNFVKMYRELFPDLVLVKEKMYPYIEGGNIDTMYLLKKK